MTYHNFADLVGDLTPAQQAQVEKLEHETSAEVVVYTLKQLCRHRNLTHAELDRHLDRAQTSISAMQTAADSLVAVPRTTVESIGGRLEVTDVLNDERIPLTPHTRIQHRAHEPERQDDTAISDRYGLSPPTKRLQA